VVVSRLLCFGTGFLECVSGVLQTFANRSFGGLRAVLDSLAGSFRPVLDSLTGLGDRILVLCIRGEYQTKSKDER